MREPIPRARLIFTVLFTIEVILGLSILCVTILFQKVLNTYLVPLDRKMLMSKFFPTYVVGFQLIACYLCSLSMWRRVWLRRYTGTVELLLGIWLFFCLIVIVSGFATTYSMMYGADSLINSVELMLMQGVDLYYANPEWKLLWDQLQYQEQCCGVKNYKDWALAKWVPKRSDQQPATPKKEKPKERMRRSIHRHYPKHHSAHKPDRDYYENAYRRRYEPMDDYPLEDDMHYEEMTEAVREKDYDYRFKFKDMFRTSSEPSILKTTARLRGTTMPNIAEIEQPRIFATTTTANFMTGSTVRAPKCKPSTNGADSENVFAPYACCKRNNANCYKYYLPQSSKLINDTMPNLSLKDINNNGCLSSFVKHVHLMLAILVAIVVIAIILDIVLCCFSKYTMIYNYQENCSRVDNTPYCDEDGNALVMVKCPPNVKCVTLEESRKRCECDSDSELPNVISCAHCSTSHVFGECSNSTGNNITAVENTVYLP